MTKIINKYGVVTGWNSLTVNFLNQDVEGIQKLSYDDTVTLENVRGAGRYPIGRSEANYEATCSLSLLKEEGDAIMNALPAGMRIQDIPPFDIIALYTRKDGSIQKDIIRNVQFTNNGREVNQGDGSIVYEHTMICSHIDWNVK